MKRGRSVCSVYFWDDVFSMKVANATFVVTDTETTGTSAESNRLIEIGAVKLRDGSVVDRFQQLVNPQRSVPGQITKLTGISTGMVFDAPTIEEVLPSYLEFLGDGIFVAHNLSFDVRFLNAELERLGRASLSNETLCTLRLARRLLPGLDSKGLSRLAQFYDITVNGRHRALGDADATGIVLKRLLRQLNYEHEIDTVEEVLAFQHRRYQKVRTVPKHLKRIREEILPDVPAEPGVYFLNNGSETPLYIGKAKSLADRVRSHFTAVESRSARKRKMLQKVRDVTWETTGTELEALLRESRLIKSEKPRYNRAQRRYYSRPFIRLDVSHEYPTISWSRTVAEDGAEYYGPVRNADQADVVVEVASRFFRLRECDDQRLHLGQRCLYADMDRCTAPCEEHDPDAYNKEVERVRAFLTGRDRSVLDRLQARMEQASAELEFEKAAAFRDARDQLERMLDKQQVVAEPVRRQNAAFLHFAGEQENSVDILFVRFGQFVESLSCRVPPTAAEREDIEAHCRAHYDPTEERPTNLSKRAVHEIRLLSQWTYTHRSELHVVRWAPDQPSEVLAEKICRELTDQSVPLKPTP